MPQEPSAVNPYESLREQTGAADAPPRKRQSDKLEVSTPCAVVFGLDLAFCVLRVVWFVLMAIAWGSALAQGARLPFVVLAWFAANGGVVLFGVAGNWLWPLQAEPSGRWLGIANALFSFAAAWIPAIFGPTSSFGPIIVVFVVGGLGLGVIFRIIFFAMYVAALIECTRRKRNDEPAYRWSDLN